MLVNGDNRVLWVSKLSAHWIRIRKYSCQITNGYYFNFLILFDFLQKHLFVAISIICNLNWKINIHACLFFRPLSFNFIESINVANKTCYISIKNILGLITMVHQILLKLYFVPKHGSFIIKWLVFSFFSKKISFLSFVFVIKPF